MFSESSTMLSQNPDWTFSDIEDYVKEIHIIATEELGLDIYPNQIEIITAEQMLDAYASNGLPITYKHWSFGKSFLQNHQQYTSGRTSLAYEIVINSNPCIAYLMEENTLAMQILVMAHASYGHNAFFKNNYLFRERTQADAIIDYMVYAQEYIAQCEQSHGIDEVEEFIDCVHSLVNQGFNHYKRPSPLSTKELEAKVKSRQEGDQLSKHPLWDKIIPKKNQDDKHNQHDEFKLPKQPTENILEFVEQYAPNMLPWQREVVKIIRQIQEYFVPQMQTQIANEGFATFVHHYIMHRLFEKGIIGEGFIQEFMMSHTNVITQPPYNIRSEGKINPYALGFAMYTDIKRICENPTDEDKEYLPHLIGKNWVDAIKHAAYDSRDETFILQYLSPKVMRDFKMFASTTDVDKDPYTEILSVCNDYGYKGIRDMLSRQNNVFEKLPTIEVIDVDTMGDRRLTLRYIPKNGIQLDDRSIIETLSRLQILWGFEVCIKCMDSTGEIVNEVFIVDIDGDVCHHAYDCFAKE